MNPDFQETLQRVRERLLAERGAHGHWEGELSSSALSTATAVIALALVDRATHAALIQRGLDWLRTHANPDGGWGDTVHSKSNISTTALAWAAHGVMNEPCPQAERWLEEEVRSQRSDVRCQEERSEHRTPNTEPAYADPPAGKHPTSKLDAINHPPLAISHLPSAIAARYGKDRTFSVPILTACALAGKISWDAVLPLPFELAVLPHQLFKWLRLPVVSYALPALIAIGQVRHHHLPPRNPLVRAVRNAARSRSLRVLEKIQPASGGFLEAAPLTSFVTMALAGMGHGAHPVAQRGVQFLVESARPDGSWPIDTNLATWLTTLAVNALGNNLTSDGGGFGEAALPEVAAGRARSPNAPQDRRSKTAPLQETVKDWLLKQQYHAEHPFTHAAPGGWAWTDLSGGVPDADDTAGALLALKRLATDEHGLNTDKENSALLAANIEHRTSNIEHRSVEDTVEMGIRWLLDLQNSDGGIPTFCRGWGTLPFDRSTPDLTAHALRAFAAWRDELLPTLAARVQAATRRAVSYLAGAQRGDGAWSPLWFGNQDAPDEENLTYGTAQVLRGLQALNDPQTTLLQQRAVAWLLAAQNPDGGWGGGKTETNIEHRTSNIEHRREGKVEIPSTLVPRHSPPASIEETALAVTALAGVPEARAAVEHGVDWLIAKTDGGRVTPAAPIGLYFAKLWYFERLYPLIFLAGALERVAATSQGDSCKRTHEPG
jgi:squalene-hopene/tetraprenyl-beta-curcumene cyclase